MSISNKQTTAKHSIPRKNFLREEVSYYKDQQQQINHWVNKVEKMNKIITQLEAEVEIHKSKFDCQLTQVTQIKANYELEIQCLSQELANQLTNKSIRQIDQVIEYTANQKVNKERLVIFEIEKTLMEDTCQVQIKDFKDQLDYQKINMQKVQFELERSQLEQASLIYNHKNEMDTLKYQILQLDRNNQEKISNQKQKNELHTQTTTQNILVDHKIQINQLEEEIMKIQQTNKLQQEQFIDKITSLTNDLYQNEHEKQSIMFNNDKQIQNLNNIIQSKQKEICDFRSDKNDQRLKNEDELQILLNRMDIMQQRTELKDQERQREISDLIICLEDQNNDEIKVNHETLKNEVRSLKQQLLISNNKDIDKKEEHFQELIQLRTKDLTTLMNQNYLAEQEVQRVTNEWDILQHSLQTFEQEKIKCLQEQRIKIENSHNYQLEQLKAAFNTQFSILQSEITDLRQQIVQKQKDYIILLENYQQMQFNSDTRQDFSTTSKSVCDAVFECRQMTLRK